MITILLQRLPHNSITVNGRMTFAIGETQLQYNTIEHADFLIPAGNYPVSMTWSNKFKKLLPLIENVPDREGIRIHTGTVPEHSTGCVLTTPGAMYNLRILFNHVDKINENKEENEPDETVIIQITDP